MGKATGPTYAVAFRRRRKNLTNYSKRLALLKSNISRMVVRKSSKAVLVEFILFDPKGDKTIVSVHSNKLKEYGWSPRCNTPSAYLCGLVAGKLAKQKGIEKFVLDIGMQTPSKGSVVFAAAKGALDAGLQTNIDSKMIDEERISGKAIASYASYLKSNDQDKFNKVFSSYLKDGFDPEKIVDNFNLVKQKIMVN